MGAPRYVFSANDINHRVYHLINWDRFGTFCDLPLNEQLTYVTEVPEGRTVCFKCEWERSQKEQKIT